MTDLDRPIETADGSEPEVSDLALLALFLSIVWLFGIGSVAAIVLGQRSLAQIRASGGELAGTSIARAAIVIGVFGLASLGLVVAMAIDASGHVPVGGSR